jgi:hypothetical protein
MVACAVCGGAGSFCVAFAVAARFAMVETRSMNLYASLIGVDQKARAILVIQSKGMFLPLAVTITGAGPIDRVMRRRRALP